MLERRRRGGIFGRDLDLAARERFLDSASMWPSAIVIEGEAGTGKQRCASRRSSREVIAPR
jgi:DNA-binding NtrC family response regulator